jgi:hypothetical protein
MGLFDALLETTIHVATSPLAVAKDIVTMGGAITDEPSAIARKVEQLGEDVDNLLDSDTLF